MKDKMIVLILMTFMLCGCKSNVNVIDKTERPYSTYFTYCDKEYGVEYIQFRSGYEGGLSVRLDENGNPIRCER